PAAPSPASRGTCSHCGYTVYDAQQDVHTTERLTLITDLRRAIAAGDLALHYQPKVDLATRRVAGVEALVRWTHPTAGYIPPDRFVALAEQSGLIMALSRWALREAFLQLIRWQETGLALPIAVNLSVGTLHDTAMIDTIGPLIAE